MSYRKNKTVIKDDSFLADDGSVEEAFLSEEPLVSLDELFPDESLSDADDESSLSEDIMMITGTALDDSFEDIVLTGPADEPETDSPEADESEIIYESLDPGYQTDISYPDEYIGDEDDFQGAGGDDFSANAEDEDSYGPDDRSDFLSNILSRFTFSQSGIIPFAVSAASIILGANGLETFGICGALGIICAAIGLWLSGKALKKSPDTFSRIARVLAAIGLGISIGCTVIGILIGIINKLAAAAGM